MGKYSYRYKCDSCGEYERNPFKHRTANSFCEHCGSFVQKSVEVGSWVPAKDDRSWWQKIMDGPFYFLDQVWVPKEQEE